MAYQIMINEEQRAIIERALALSSPQDEEGQALLRMIIELPNDEREMPGVLHGLCL